MGFRHHFHCGDLHCSYAKMTTNATNGTFKLFPEGIVEAIN